MKMKKMMFLMLTLFFLGAAGMNAQVTIGSEDNPHPAAVLDLKSTTQGMILPNVTLSNNVTDFNLSGDKVTAKGLVVYNTGDTPGIYIWDGASWNRLNSCTLPSASSSFTFNPMITNPVAPHALITISVFAVSGATSYNWTLPDSLAIEGVANGNSIKVRVLKTIAGTIDASGISVAAANACGTSSRINATGTITVQEIAPAQPTFSISRTTVNSNGMVTLTCQDVGADSYTWTFPAAFSGVSPTTRNTITLQANTDGKYAARLFTVVATNAYGNSAKRTASGDTIIAGNCTEAPAIISAGSTFGYSRLVGGERYEDLTLNTKGNTIVDAKFPAGLSLIEATNNRIRFSLDKPGIYSGKDVVITVTNDCGTTIGDFGDAVLTVVPNSGHPGPDVEVEGTTYQTWTLPSNVTWMVGFSKSGSPDYSVAPYNPLDTRYGYYKLANAASGCPTPFRLPTKDEALGLLSLFNSYGVEFELRVGVKIMTGNYGITGNASNQGSSYWHIANNERVWLLLEGGNTIAETNPQAGFLVKCVKD